MDRVKKVTEALIIARRAYMEATRSFEETTGIRVCNDLRILIRGGNEDLNDEKVEKLAKHLGVEVTVKNRNDPDYRYEREFKFQSVEFTWINNKPKEES